MLRTKTKKKPRPADPNQYPPGLDDKRVKEIIAYYDARQDVDVLDEIETSAIASNMVWVEVPSAIIPQVKN